MKFIQSSLIATSLAMIGGCNTPEDNRPNVILILADDLGYNDLTCYRNSHLAVAERPPTCQTPNIDRLAEEGTRFTDFYSGAAVCSPSRSALLTGRNATRVGIYNWIPGNNPMHLRDEEVTIAEMLREAGYRAGHFGKWHLTSEGMEQPHPLDQGFETSFFTYNNAEPSHDQPVNFYSNNEPIGPTEGYACQIVMDEALHWLEALDRNTPFYLNLWFNEPHRRVAAPEKYTSRHTYNEEYYGCIENMDDAVGRLLAFLDEQELSDHTIVIFTSDNGADWPHSNDPLRGAKAFNFEGGIREPFIVRYPGKVPAGAVNHVPGYFPDVLPTIASFTGAELPDDRTLDGVSLEKVFLGSDASPEREVPIFFFRYFHDPVTMLREGDWCLLGFIEPIPLSDPINVRELAKFKPGEGQSPWSQWSFQEGHMEAIPDMVPVHFELYNLRNDLSQQHDVSGEHPGRVQKMIETTLELRDEMIREGGDWYGSN